MMKKLTKIVLLLCFISFNGCKNETSKKPVLEKETASKKDRQLNSVAKKIDEIMIHHRKCSYRRIYKMVRGS